MCSAIRHMDGRVAWSPNQAAELFGVDPDKVVPHSDDVDDWQNVCFCNSDPGPALVRAGWAWRLGRLDHRHGRVAVD